MTKEDSELKKNYSNLKIIHLDPLAARLAAVGFEGGASKSALKAKSMLSKVRVQKRKNQKAIENAAQGKNVVLRNMPMDSQRKIMSKFKETKSILNKSENTIKTIIKKRKFASFD
jgi:hypothetical protein